MICCVTGHRPKGFPFEREPMDASYNKYLRVLNEAMEDLIDNGCIYYISGMAYGADLDFADMVLDYKAMDKKIEKSSILRNCDYINFISSNYFRGCMQKRNRYMVDK